jgi:hypothetical protein
MVFTAATNQRCFTVSRPRKFLEEEGLLKRVFTQNIDGLDYQTGELQVAGSRRFRSWFLGI